MRRGGTVGTRVAVRALGGTVAMTSASPDGGASPTLDAAGLLSAIPRLARVASVDAATLSSVPSASLRIPDLVRYIDDLGKSCESGAEGTVVTTGTDSLEEVAYLFELLWTRPEPLVVTGAMRTADAPGADGPANVLGAVTVGASRAARGRGCLVVMNDEIHAARTVRKLHTTSCAAFGSPCTGPVGRVHEGSAWFSGPPSERFPFGPLAPATPVPRVALVRVSLSDEGTLLNYALDTADAVVVESFGGGHLPHWWADPLIEAAQRMPVVLASRTGAGPMLRETYGFMGSERHLLEGGLLSAGELDGLKARLLLTVLLMQPGVDVGEEFSRRASASAGDDHQPV